MNTNSGKIHNPWCTSVSDIKPENRWNTNTGIEELEAAGYVKCKKHGDWDR